MSLPGVVVNVTSAATPRTIPTDTGQAFFAGVTQSGSIVKPILCRNMVDFTTRFGARLASSVLYDSAETFFGEGGSKLWVSRVYGSGATQASVNLLDSGSGISLVVKAGSKGDANPGVWANGAAGGLSVAVIANGSNYQLVTYLNGVIVESSYVLTTQADAINWSVNSNYITVTLGATGLVPAVAAAANLTGGTDGSAVADADWQAALDRIPGELGPGQVAAPGRTTSVGQLQVLAHAAAYANNRWAVLDAADTATSSTLLSAALALYGAPNTGRRYGQLNAPWEIIPGLTANTFRTVPPSARACAQYARVDALGNPNQAAAGRYGTAQFVTDLSQPAWDAPTRQALNEAGVTVSRRRFAGSIVTYGFRSLADQIQDTQWSFTAGNRTIMWYVAQGKAILENHEFEQVDGFGHYTAAVKGDLMAPAMVLLGKGALYTDAGSSDPSTAFYVDTGPAVNSVANLAAGITAANVKMRVSPGAEVIQLNIIRTPITQAI